MVKPFLLLKEQRATWCMVLINVDPLLLVFRVTREADNLSIYAKLRSFSPSRMHKPGKIILYGEFYPTPYCGWGEHKEESEPESEPVFEDTMCPFVILCPPCLVTLTSHWISLYLSFQTCGKKVTVFSSLQSALRLLDEKHCARASWGY